MDQISNRQSCCATCTYWMGYRKPNSLGYVEVESSMKHGQCAKWLLTQHYTRQAMACCSNYIKWAALR